MERPRERRWFTDREIVFEKERRQRGQSGRENVRNGERQSDNIVKYNNEVVRVHCLPQIRKGGGGEGRGGGAPLITVLWYTVIYLTEYNT